MLTPLQIQERAEAITARLRYVADHAAGGDGVYTLPATGKVIDFSHQKNGWKLSRLLYRVGELRITGAIDALLAVRPLLVAEFDVHAFVRTLGIIGTKEHIPLVEELRRQHKSSAIIVRAARQSILQLGGKLEAVHLSDLSSFSGVTTPEGLNSRLQEMTRDDEVNDWLYPLYLSLYAESPSLLPSLVLYLVSLPQRGNYFQPLRYILKAAEQLADYPTVGALFCWIWKGVPVSSVQRRYDYKEIGGRWRSVLRSRSAYHPAMPYDWQNPTSLAEMSKQRNTKWGFTPATRQSLLRRGYRLLTTLGNSQYGKGYVDMATNILLALNDQTVEPPSEESTGRYVYDQKARRHRYVQYKIYYPEAADLVPLHWIVNGGETGYEIDSTKTFVSGSQPFTALTGRRERYAPLWDERPEPIIRLLGESTMRLVQDFSLRVFTAKPDFSAALTATDIDKMLVSQHEGINGLVPLVLTNRPELVTDAITYALIVHEQEALRDWVANNLKSKFGLVFVPLLTEKDPTRLAFALAWLERFHAAELAQISEEQLSALARHPLPAAGLLAARLLRERQPQPYALILQLMTAEHVEVRAAGIEIFGTLPLENLYANHRETVLGMCVAEPEEIRDVAVPIARKLAQQYPDFGKELVTTLVDFLRMRGQATEIHATISELLCHAPIRPYLTEVSDEEIWKLLRSRKVPAQQVGFVALTDRKSTGTLSTNELVELGRHDWVDVREFAHQRLTTSADRSVYEVLDFVRLFDTHWEDSRTFAKQFLRDRLTARDWTPEVLIALLDIPREDVQVFTLEFVERYVGKTEATDFLLRASQHPGRQVQGFAANWLETHATGQPEVIEQLEPFFKTLLSQISRGRVAKDRVFTFLASESAKNESTAQLVIPLLERLMLTIAIGDRARCLQILNDLRRRYPHLDTPLQVTATNLSQPKKIS